MPSLTYYSKHLFKFQQPAQVFFLLFLCRISPYEILMMTCHNHREFIHLIMKDSHMYEEAEVQILLF